MTESVKEHKVDLHKRENKWLEDKDKLIEKQEENNSEVLQLTLGIYFLILKKKPKPVIISAAFEGLARYARLINIEFFVSLLNVMDEFFSTRKLSTFDQLNCLKTVFAILQTQQESLAIDPYQFFIHLYNVFEKISFDFDYENLQVLASIMELIYKGKKLSVVSHARMKALMKRFASLAISIPGHVASIAILATIGQLCRVNSCTESLFDTDTQGCPGIFTIFNKEPDRANAGGTSLWELYAARRSYHPHVRQLAESLIDGEPFKHPSDFFKNMTNKDCKVISSDYNMKNGFFNPKIPPLEKLKIIKNDKKLVDPKSGNFEVASFDLHCLYQEVMKPEQPQKKRKAADIGQLAHSKKIKLGEIQES